MALANNSLTCKIIRMNPIFNELTEPILMNVDAAGLSMMDLALYDSGIGSGLDFEAGNTIVVDVILLKVALET